MIDDLIENAHLKGGLVKEILGGIGYRRPAASQRMNDDDDDSL